MKTEHILLIIAALAIGFFYWKANKKPVLAVQILGEKSLLEKGTPGNPVTSSDIEALKVLLIDLLSLKEQQS
jgi:hypothetical protein